MAKRPANVVVKQDEEKPVEKEILAEAIVSISKAMKKMLATGMNRRAILVLVHDYHHGNVTKSDIGLVFDALDSLAETYTNVK